jgi:hypothetical protein
LRRAGIPGCIPLPIHKCRSASGRSALEGRLGKSGVRHKRSPFSPPLLPGPSFSTGRAILQFKFTIDKSL